jgi:FkbM family methyltransferase
MNVFIDCGAHCGESILRAKSQFGIGTRTISFEPIPYFANEISKIWEADESVDVVNAAVWIEDGVKDFEVSTVNTDGSSLFDLPATENEYISIPVNTFDFSEFLKQFETRDFKLIVKFDIEGAEYHVLNKMIEDGTINYVDEFWGEWHEPKTDEQKLLEQKVHSFLEENNITFNIWEQHIPLVGKSHELLVDRPKFLKDII